MTHAEVWRAQIAISPGFMPLSPSRRARNLLTVHDLIHLNDTVETSAAKRWMYSSVIKKSILGAGVVVTVSHTSARKLREFIGTDEVKIVIAPNGTDWVSMRDDAVTHHDGIDPYILLVTNPRHHKNNSVGFEALKYTDLSLKTVGLGEIESSRLAIGAGIKDSRIQNFTGISDKEMQVLYKGAQCVLLPSFEEGFGLPALEAAAMGTPTVYHCDSVAEIVDSLGVRVADPNDPAAFGSAIVAAADAKPRLSAPLVERARLFTWDRTALAYVDAVDSMVDRWSA